MKTNHQAGHDAEKRAAQYLKDSGYKIRELNWKTKLCEIDIVAEKDKVIYFAEVKYRKTTRQGEGWDYITPAKLHQMTFAAEMWVTYHDWEGDYRLLAVAMNPEQIEVIELG